MVTHWPVSVELSAFGYLDKIAIRRDIYSANSFIAYVGNFYKVFLYQLNLEKS